MKAIAVQTDHGASDAEVRAVSAAFRDFGLPVEAERQTPPLGAGGPDGWVVYATLSGFFGAAGAAAYGKLAALIRRVANSRKSAPVDFGTLIISDPKGGDLAIAITEKPLPPEAWDQLDEIVAGGAELRDHRWYWDPKARVWRSHHLSGPYPDDVSLPEQMPRSRRR